MKDVNLMIRKTMLAACLTMLPAIAFAEGHGDAEKGERVFKKCKACHAVGEGAKNKVGPALNGIVGGPVGAAEGYKYSDVLMGLAGEGKVWTAAELDAFLEKPRNYAKGTKMSFAGLRKEEERANVIAYLATFTK